MASVYILFSPKLQRYYTGSCKDLSLRLKDHSELRYRTSFTSRARDWILFFHLDNLQPGQAREIEFHIKRMKSKKYIENLKRYPPIAKALVLRYA